MKNATISLRRNFLRKTTFSAAFTPWSWKKCFDVSMPIRLTCSTDGLHCLRSATTSFWHNRCRRGPSTPSLLARAAFVVEGNDIFGRPRHVNDDEADAWIELCQMGRHPLECPASAPMRHFRRVEGGRISGSS